MTLIHTFLNTHAPPDPQAYLLVAENSAKKRSKAHKVNAVTNEPVQVGTGRARVWSYTSYVSSAQASCRRKVYVIAVTYEPVQVGIPVIRVCVKGL